MNLDLDAFRQEQVNALLQKTIEDRKQQEKEYHKERLTKLMQERLELELRLIVLNDVIKQIEDHTKNNPLFKE